MAQARKIDLHSCKSQFKERKILYPQKRHLVKQLSAAKNIWIQVVNKYNEVFFIDNYLVASSNNYEVTM